MTKLERSHAEFRAAVLLAGREIRRLNFGRADSPILVTLRRVLREARVVARKEGFTGASDWTCQPANRWSAQGARHHAFGTWRTVITAIL